MVTAIADMKRIVHTMNVCVRYIGILNELVLFNGNIDDNKLEMMQTETPIWLLIDDGRIIYNFTATNETLQKHKYERTCII